MKNMKLFLFICACFSILCITNARDIHTLNNENEWIGPDRSISGKLIDSLNSQAIEYADVILYSEEDSSLVKGTVSDNSGNFSFNNISYGVFYLIINYMGYESIRLSDIRISKDQKSTDLGTIYLKPAIKEIEDVQVVGNKPFMQYRIDKKVINVSSQTTSSGENVVAVLRKVPSIEVDPDGSVKLRGSSNFKVLVNGKHSAIEGNDLLKMTLVSEVDSIELITNPSAEYDPEGATGIINLITKKNLKKGFSGILNGSVFTRDKYNASISASYNTPKFNFSTSLSYNYFPFQLTGHSYREEYGADTTYLKTEIINNLSTKNYKIRADIDYNLSEKNTVSLSCNVPFYNYGRDLTFKYDEFTGYSKSDDNLDLNVTAFEISLTDEHKFRNNQTLKLSGSYILNPVERENPQSIYTSDEMWNLIALKSKRKLNVKSNNYRHYYLLNYLKPFKNKGQMELGYQMELNNSESNYIFYDFNFSSDLFEIDDTATNSFDFIRNIYSVYGTLTNDLFGFQYKIGLRLQFISQYIDQITYDEKYIYEKLIPFPSLHISRQLSNDQQVQLSYSRRIDYPLDYQLNPYPYYSDSSTRYVGNPDLVPGLTNSYELNYQKIFKKITFSFGLYYRQTKDRIQEIRTLTEENVLENIMTNVDFNDAFGIELNSNFKLIKWLDLNPSVAFSVNTESGEFFGTHARVQDKVYNLKLNTTITFSKNSKFQIFAYYSSPHKWLQGRMRDNYAVNLSLNQTFLRNKLTLSLYCNDVFQTSKLSGTMRSENFYTDDKVLFEAPIISFNLTYLINKFKSYPQNRESDNYEKMGGGVM